MKKRIKLNQLSVQSFVTSISKKEEETINGGLGSRRRCTKDNSCPNELSQAWKKGSNCCHGVLQ